MSFLMERLDERREAIGELGRTENLRDLEKRVEERLDHCEDIRDAGGAIVHRGFRIACVREGIRRAVLLCPVLGLDAWLRCYVS